MIIIYLKEIDQFLHRTHRLSNEGITNFSLRDHTDRRFASANGTPDPRNTSVCPNGGEKMPHPVILSK